MASVGHDRGRLVRSVRFGVSIEVSLPHAVPRLAAETGVRSRWTTTAAVRGFRCAKRVFEVAGLAPRGHTIHCAENV